MQRREGDYVARHTKAASSAGTKTTPSKVNLKACTNLEATRDDVPCVFFRALMNMVHWACHASQCALHWAQPAIRRRPGCVVGQWARQPL